MPAKKTTAKDTTPKTPTPNTAPTTKKATKAKSTKPATPAAEIAKPPVIDVTPVAEKEPEKKVPETFAQMKFGGVPSSGVQVESPKPEAQPEPPKQEPELQPESEQSLLKPNQWVKVLSGKFINRVGMMDSYLEDGKVVVNLQGIRLTLSPEDLEGLNVSQKRSNYHFTKFYRQFDVYTVDSLGGGLYGHAINRDLNIRLERHYHGVSVEDVGKVMIGLVDEVIEERELDIPPYQPPASKNPQQDNTEFYAEANVRWRQEEQARRDALTFTFEAMSGVQAGGLMFTAILTFKKVKKLIDVDLRKIPQEERYQRVPSPARVKALSNYIIQYPDTYILPSLTCTIEGEYEFSPLAPRSSLGSLTLLPGTKLHPIDGGHRLNSINAIVNQMPKLEEEQICVTFVIDRGLKQRRQWFSDINKEQVKPPKAISLEFDRRDREANFHRNVIDEIPLFAKYTKRTKGSASGKGSNNLFVLTWLHGANKTLRPDYNYDTDFKYCIAYWKAVIANTPVLANYDPQNPRMSPAEVREHLCCTALALKAFAMLGKGIFRRFEDSLEGLEDFLEPLSQIDWDKENEEWEDLIIETVKGRVEKKKILTRNTDQLLEYLKHRLTKK
jgi:DNA sulfur modification protein DndB